ncbi:uncharacterized protein N7515_008869 [Penicillium bovifimosum]|uniref:Rhodopsin domain-containing protein n=1 Tax=Penicillium bovifimosum TaxID=126998 RepID=A0A9W9GP30_9EURO|nr:uncharacterized protein N7515_008869 [Penicillium bovifimosum]KAJ5125044.1 hypothetical protein N7515_008869 [Penicillium bovifimosum]
MEVKPEAPESLRQDNSRNLAILIVTAVFFGLSLVAVILRCFVRTHIVRVWGWDDRIMVLAMALNTVFAVCGLVGARFGLGRPLSYFSQHPDNFHNAMLCWWLGQLFYVLTCVVAKISIMIALLRITVDRIHAYILYGAITLATVVGLIFFFFTTFQCSPVNFFWNQRRAGAHGSCLDQDLLTGIAYMYSVGAALTDLTIGLLPVALIWNLRMNRRTKAAIVGILGIGCVASAAVIIRIPFIHHYNDEEFLFNTYQIAIWSNVEAGIGITAGCLTTLRPLYRYLRHGSSGEPSPTQGSYNLSNHPAAFRRSKPISVDDASQLWTGRRSSDNHGTTTTIMGAQQKSGSSSEDLNPNTELSSNAPTRWKVERSFRVSVRDE